MRRTEERNSPVESESCDQLRSDLDHTAGDENDDDDHESAAHQAPVAGSGRRRQQHEDNAERHALVGHVGVEHDARQSKIDKRRRR